MKGFKKILILALVFAIFYYVFGGNPDKSKRQSTVQAPPPPPLVKVAPAPIPPPPPAHPDSMADKMLPPWPPALAKDTATPLADSLTTKNFVLILDGSGSMSKQGCSGDRSKSEVAKNAVIDWASSVPADANLGLVAFDRHGFSIRLPLGLGNRQKFNEEVNKIIPDYKTPLTMALNTAYDMLTKQARKQLGYGDYTVVIVTDGAADDIQALEKTVNMVLATSPIMIYTIGFCISSDHSLNRQGRTVYRAANNPQELKQGLQEVLAESESFDIKGFK